MSEFAVTLYTLWASLPRDPESFWMIACEDEWSWEGNPDRCEIVFQNARNIADENGWTTREVEIKVDLDPIAAAFLAGKTTGEATVVDPTSAQAALPPQK